jgi:hypothetical protein
MRCKTVLATVLCLAVVSLAAIAAGPAAAVIGGQQDNGTPAQFPGVGMNLEYGWWVPGFWGFAGSCTLVKNEPGEVIVMTAAHAVWGSSAEYLATNVKVTFDPCTSYEWNLILPEGLPGDLETYSITDVKMHPGFDVDTPYRGGLGNSKPSVIGPGREDVALMWLDRQVLDADGDAVPAASIVGRHVLDGLDLKSETFTAVGYGFNDWLVGNVQSWTSAGRAAAMWSGRNYAGASVVSTDAAFTDRYLMTTSAVNSFDSGGAVFLGDTSTIVAIPAFGSNRAASPSYNYRLDTDSAQDFLDAYLE